MWRKPEKKKKKGQGINSKIKVVFSNIVIGLKFYAVEKSFIILIIWKLGIDNTTITPTCPYLEEILNLFASLSCK